jgi:hypothetical protein
VGIVYGVRFVQMPACLEDKALYLAALCLIIRDDCVPEVAVLQDVLRTFFLGRQSFLDPGRVAT